MLDIRTQPPDVEKLAPLPFEVAYCNDVARGINHDLSVAYRVSAGPNSDDVQFWVREELAPKEVWEHDVTEEVTEHLKEAEDSVSLGLLLFSRKRPEMTEVERDHMTAIINHFAVSSARLQTAGVIPIRMAALDIANQTLVLDELIKRYESTIISSERAYKQEKEKEQRQKLAAEAAQLALGQTAEQQHAPAA